MNINNKPFREWFGYSRRERRSTFILIILLIIIIFLHYIIPLEDKELVDLSTLLPSTDDVKDSLLSPTTYMASLYKFDPNSASYDTLTALGLSGKQARTIVSYRKKGGMFRQPSDLKKAYGIDESTFARLSPYISIEQRNGGSVGTETGVISDQKKREKIDLNSADSATLVRLPGIGPVLSPRIIKYRKLLGGFISVEQLKEVYGLDEEKYKLVEEKVIADTSKVTRIYINNAGLKELSKHPYLNRYDVQSIIKFRVLKGRITDIGELIENKVLSEDKAKRISPYVKF